MSFGDASFGTRRLSKQASRRRNFRRRGQCRRSGGLGPSNQKFDRNRVIRDRQDLVIVIYTIRRSRETRGAHPHEVRAPSWARWMSAADAALGGRRGRSDRARRAGGGLARDGPRTQHRRARAQRAARRREGRRPCERPTQRRGRSESRRGPSRVAACVEAARRPRDERGSGVRFAMEREERCRFVARAVRRARHPSERQDHRQTAPSTRLQPSGCEEDRRGQAAPGSQRAVRAHRCGGEALRRARRAVHLRRHEEEASWSATSRTRASSGNRRTRRSSSTCTIFPGDALGKAIPYGGLRRRGQQRLRQCRHRP